MNPPVGRAVGRVEPGLDARHPALAPLLAAGYDAGRIEQVLALYDQPHRCYHDRAHVREMLDAACALDCPLAPAQALAVLFHDAVYVPGAARGHNELMSAQLLRVYADRLAPDVVEAAYQIIIDTGDHVPRSDAARLVLDLDLMRLAGSAAEFERYSRQVFAEQRQLVPVADDAAAWRFFEQRRVAFFERLLQRQQVFRLPQFQARFEAVARANLQRALNAARTLTA